MSAHSVRHITQNKSLSDDSEEILRLQGVGWFTRKAIALATLYLSVKHYRDDGGVEHIDIDQTLTGGIKATNEYRTLDWVEREHEDTIFGSVVSKSRRVSLDEIEQDFLKKDWLDASFDEGKVINSVAASNTAKSNTTWTATQVSAIRLAAASVPQRFVA